MTLSRHTLVLDCGGRPLDLTRPAVMGILNITPDSFSDGGRYQRMDDALRQAERMAAEGAAIIDVGGESTRPGAPDVSLDEELARVVPVVEALSRRLPLPLSVDTSKPEVMRAAVEAGAGMINDVRALEEPGAVGVAANLGVPVCLMHMRGQPRSMQDAPHYDDVVAEVREYLERRVEVCVAGGISHSQLLVDPGFGFGKALEHNVALLRGLENLQSLGLPVLVGMSRKRMIGALLGDVPVEARTHGSVAASMIAAQRGARLLRVHDVGPTVDALKIWAAVGTGPESTVSG